MCVRRWKNYPLPLQLRKRKGIGSRMNAPTGRVGETKHFLDLSEFDSQTLQRLIADAKRRKALRAGLPKGAPDTDQPLEGRVLALIFDKQSTRTRISFDVGNAPVGRHDADADGHGNAACPRGNDRRHRARAVALRRCA